MHSPEAVAEKLRALLEDIVGGAVPLDEPGARTVPLWNLGLTSTGFMRLLDAIDETFGVEWDLLDSVDAVSSFDNLVAHIAAEPDTRAAVREGADQ
ncbi:MULTISPECIES: phosphopantetheine-binding protein [Streptomyces]|uniref:Acyl carrier protein n=1 Tax=Streptomyces buecherae TaxID=2763006 RepID=A0A7G8KHX1_9ACTN|nr:MULTISPECIES: phosphopantetheine-binding protein [Streptomyces]MBC3984454.1 acyl carrier protein [Streptomyces buecherae]MBC3988214.1 acyl carrier protein [Streptomyces buecherae]QKW49737.1 acyl carrier protein [Streptomyces buecherae]QNJ42654.1 acyl carrier protein [Streptomyces buecherae]WEV27997.1 phosphopantetheine-binding protein [Streptomyces sp. 71268]